MSGHANTTVPHKLMSHVEIIGVFEGIHGTHTLLFLHNVNVQGQSLDDTTNHPDCCREVFDIAVRSGPVWFLSIAH